MTAPALDPKPWYREPWPWFLISLPATAVIAGVTTVWIASTDADGLVTGDYYKAGLAINQTLAREQAASALALSATLNREDGALSLQLNGRLSAHPQQVTVRLAHPTRSGHDHAIVMDHAGNGRYRAALPDLPAGKWLVELTDAASAWRLSGVLYAPLDHRVILAAPVVRQPEGV